MTIAGERAMMMKTRIFGYSIFESVYVLVTVFIFVAGIVALYFPTLSVIINDLVKYGKSATKSQNRLLRLLSVPKRCFSHFYIVAVTMASFWLAFAILADYDLVRPETKLNSYFQWATYPRQRPTINATTCLLTLALIWLHVVRRLWETLFISVYSETEMNVLHYILGIAHYTLLPMFVVAECPGFLNNDEFSSNFSTLNPFGLQTFGVLLFVYCSYSQHSCVEQLAAMRRNHLGNIINYAHGIPYGGWFDCVSCPHFLHEIGIYLALCLTLACTHHLWYYVLVFVVVNQTIAARITHKWYLERFKHQYPAERKAIIPYLL